MAATSATTATSSVHVAYRCGARAQRIHLINMTLLNRPYTAHVRASAASGVNKLRHVWPHTERLNGRPAHGKRTITTQPGAERAAPAGPGAMILKSIRFLLLSCGAARDVPMYPICSMRSPLLCCTRMRTFVHTIHAEAYNLIPRSTFVERWRSGDSQCGDM